MSPRSLFRRLMLRAFESQNSFPIRNTRLLIGLSLEQLEDRTVPAIAHTTYVIAGRGLSPDGSPTPPSAAFTPSGIDQAYGINLITYGGIQQEGAGQTIAIIDAYDDPDIVSSSSASFDSSDLHQFDE